MSSQADKWERLFDDTLAQQEGRKESLERRANDVLRGVSTIVTILVAVGALVLGQGELDLNGVASLVLIIALLLLLAAGLVSLRVLSPRPYEALLPESLGKLIREKDAYTKYWTEPVPTRAQYRVAEIQLKLLVAAERANDAKAIHLKNATWLAFAGVALLGVVLVVTIVSQ